jgi:hypothetical protein
MVSVSVGAQVFNVNDHLPDERFTDLAIVMWQISRLIVPKGASFWQFFEFRKERREVRASLSGGYFQPM